jgi:hypothetical protein
MDGKFEGSVNGGGCGVEWPNKKKNEQLKFIQNSKISVKTNHEQIVD